MTSQACVCEDVGPHGIYEHERRVHISQLKTHFPKPKGLSLQLLELIEFMLLARLNTTG